MATGRPDVEDVRHLVDFRCNFSYINTNLQFEKSPEKADDMAYVTRLSREVRVKLQKKLHSQLKKRHTIFL